MLLAVPVQGAVVLVEDPSGDQRLSMPDGRFRIPTAGTFQHADLVEAGVWQESATELVLFARPASLSAQSEHNVPYGDPEYDIRFSHGLQGYRVLVKVFLENQGTALFGDPETVATLEKELEEDVFVALADVASVVDVDEGVILTTVPRSAIRDHNEAAAGRNATLTDFSAQARAMGWFSMPIGGTSPPIVVGPLMAHDRAPDSYFEDASYEMKTGATLSRGELLAGTSDPVRWTNGEATTFVYTIRLTNLGAQKIVSVAPVDVPGHWQVAFSDRYTVPANTHINVTFHVAIPFAHSHGLFEEFGLQFTSVDAGHEATARMGVYWPLVPQPAGHHDHLWLHSVAQAATNPFQIDANEVHGWFNAAKQDERDTATPIPPDFIALPDDGTMQAHWRLLLEPSLRMGLDFLLEKVGEGTMTLQFPIPVSDPTLTFELRHYDRRFIVPRVTTLVVAEATHTGQASGTIPFVFESLAPRDAADLIRYLPAADLELNLTLTGVIPGLGFENPSAIAPSLLPDQSEFTLPLLEYHDPLEATFFTDASARITVGTQGQEREVNPGEQVVYNMTLHYNGVFATDFVIELTGHQDWAVPLGDARFTMEPGTAREVAIAVQPPLNAPEGTFDTTIRLVSTTNAAVEAGMVVRTTVVHGADVPDETALATEKALGLTSKPPKDGFPWLWVILPIVLAGLGGAGWWFRRDLLWWR